MPEVKQEVDKLLNEDQDHDDDQDVDDQNIDPIEEEARKDGWKPEEEYDGPEGSWIPADEFMRRKPLFEKIHNQSKELKGLRQEVNALSTHYKKVYESSYKKALEDLQAQRREAIEAGDTATAFELGDEILEVRDKMREEVPKNNQEQEQQIAFNNFVNDNPWYRSNPEMKAFADEVGVRYFNSNPDASYDEVYAYAKKRVEKEYSEELGIPRPTPRKRINDVEGDTNKGGKGSSKKLADIERSMTPEQKQIMNTLVRNKHVTKEQYLKEFSEV